MSERRCEVKQVEYSYTCDTCHKGNMKHIPENVSDYRVKGFLHQCDNTKCGVYAYLPAVYPQRVEERWD